MAANSKITLNQLQSSMTGIKTYIDNTTGGKKQVYLTEAEYNILTNEQKNDDSIVYNITDVDNNASFAFNADGDLEVTINGVTKVFAPKA